MESSNRYGDLESIVDEIFGGNDEQPSETPVENAEVGTPDVEPVEEVEDEVVDETNGDVSDDSIEESPSDGEDLVDDTDVAEESDEDEPVEEDETDEPEADDLLSKLVTVKVNGEEMQVSVEQAVKGYQMAAAANAKFEEAAQVRKEAAEAVDFRETFDRMWSSDQSELISHFVSIADDVNDVVEAVILRAAALGKLSPQIAEALQITPEVSQRLSLAHQQEQLERERKQIAEEREKANINPDEVPDQHGFTVVDYRNAIDEMVKLAGMENATVDERKAFVQQVFEYGDRQGIVNPYLAFASYREHTARKEVERSNRAKKAVAKVSSNTRTSAALSPKGQVQHAPTTPVLSNTADAAAWALQELERQHGAL